jgi:hypothetical protein
MTAPTETEIEAGERFFGKLLEGDPARLDVATDDEVVAMMDAANVQGSEPESVEAMLARGQRRARERAERAAQARAASGPEAKGSPKKAVPRAVWVAGALVAAAAAAVVVVETREPPKPGPDAIGPDRPAPPPTPAEQATRLRDEAVLACEFLDYAACARKLDEARALDPAGESEPRVIEARKQLAHPAPPPSVGPKVPPKAP